jgi:hypothetical protein
MRSKKKKEGLPNFMCKKCDLRELVVSGEHEGDGQSCEFRARTNTQTRKWGTAHRSGMPPSARWCFFYENQKKTPLKAGGVVVFHDKALPPWQSLLHQPYANCVCACVLSDETGARVSVRECCVLDTLGELRLLHPKQVTPNLASGCTDE